MIKLTFHGAAGTVTGSQHLIEVNGKRLLLDCGLYQGKRKEAFERNRQLPFDPASLDAVVLSHAHIDHSGNLPTLAKHGFKGDITCTPATRDLCAAMLLDSAHIQEKDVEFVNRRRARQGQNLFEPLYTQPDALEVMRSFATLSYDRPREILPGVHLTLIDAGHMLGSATVILDIEEQAERRQLRLVFSGDIGKKNAPIIRDPVPVRDGADVLIMESTYGNRLHPADEDTERELERIINDTYRRGGCIIIPAFAVGRTQTIVYSLHRLYNKRDIPAVPIFVDSPLATDVTSVFRLHQETYDEEMRQFLLTDDDQNPFGFQTLRYTRSVEESKALNFLREPAIIISASGMMENGRVLHHLRNRISDPRTTVIIVGWQAPDTLGRRLVEGAEKVRIFGEEIENRAHVETLLGFSGHADRNGLLEWAGAMEKKPARTFLVHGEPEAASALADALKAETGFSAVDIPVLHQSFEV